MKLVAKKTLNRKRYYLRVARTLRDKLDGLITLGVTDLGTQKKILSDVSQELDLVLANKATHRCDEISTCTHSCSKHEQVLNPALWSTLPMELLQRVFEKLPFPNICRLKSLSRIWKLSLQFSSSEFTLALKESSPRVLARVSLGEVGFLLHVLDGRNNRWHELRVYVADRPADRPAEFRLIPIENSVDMWVHMNGATDAGLVCYVERDFETDFSNCIYVVNPMTGVLKQLPIMNLLKHSMLTMMRIVVDHNTYHYKVIAVDHAPLVEAEVYDSEVQQWTKPKPSLGRIFGIAHYWSREKPRDEQSVWRVHKLGPCAYDCRDGKYYDFEQDKEKWSGKKVISYTLVKDRLFVLHWKAGEFAPLISEYCVPENATSWVEEKTHSCFPRFVRKPRMRELTGRIHACSGFLFVSLLKKEDGWFFDADPHKKHEYGWVYDLATCEGRALPPVPWRSESFMTNMMCELHWNSRP